MLRRSLTSSLPSRYKTLIIEVKNDIKEDSKVFLCCPVQFYVIFFYFFPNNLSKIVVQQGTVTE